MADQLILPRQLVNTLIMTLDEHYDPEDIIDVVDDVMHAYSAFLREYGNGE